MVTNKSIHNVDGNEIKRTIEIERVHALTEGKDCGEFILHVVGDYDYQFISKQ